MFTAWISAIDSLWPVLVRRIRNIRIPSMARSWKVAKMTDSGFPRSIAPISIEFIQISEWYLVNVPCEGCEKIVSIPNKAHTHHAYICRSIKYESKRSSHCPEIWDGCFPHPHMWEQKSAHVVSSHFKGLILDSLTQIRQNRVDHRISSSLWDKVQHNKNYP